MKRILSGITPSGDGTLHIGNYLGAVKQFIDMARTNECFLFVADLHALTTIQNKTQLQNNVESLILNELALLKGFLTPEEFDRLVFFRQSDMKGLHPELQTIINNVTPLGLLKRAHAYKDKLQKETFEDDINVGLFSYPILMAADILMYKPDLVPVGKDQKQHVEIARDIAERFNRVYKKQMFKLPDPFIPDDVATIMGTDGKRKMSKSLGNIISIFESEEIIKKQVMSTYTDPTRAHATDKGHVEGNVVFVYLNFFGEKDKVDQLKQAYTNGQIADIEVKQYLYESLLKYFASARKQYEALKQNPQIVKDILARGAERAQTVAGETMKEVKNTIGLMNTYSFQTIKKSTITVDDFADVEIRVGKVEQADHVEKSEKLIRLHVDFGEFGTRIIFTGVRTYGYTADDFVNKQFFFVVNLIPRKMMGEESQGMIIAIDGPDGKPLFVSGEHLPIGSRIR
ncbi:MAG: tryptophan--tRNA ligase [Candidatus Gottesmanbacteria bacterium]